MTPFQVCLALSAVALVVGLILGFAFGRSVGFEVGFKRGINRGRRVAEAEFFPRSHVARVRG